MNKHTTIEKYFSIGILSLCCFLVYVSAEDTAKKDGRFLSAEDTAKKEGRFLSAEDAAKKDGRFFLPVKYIKYTTNTVYSISTSTLYNFCVSGSVGAGGQCTGKKRRRRATKELASNQIEQDLSVDLDGSRSDVVGRDTQPSSGSEKILKFTIYTTTSSTSTVTVKYTDTASTLTLSFYCYTAGLSVPSVCG